MLRTLDDPFYYLGNFQRALDWVHARYDHLLNDEERAFALQFVSLPRAARALLVRMVMRKGSLFRAGKLRYPEIGCPRDASLPLVARGWVDARPLLTLDQVFGLLTKSEIASAFGLPSARASLPKSELLESLRAECGQTIPFDAWAQSIDDVVYRIEVDPLCARLRLLFFGNAYQDWSEFVLADLGIYRYESVALSGHSHGFRSREDVDLYQHLQACRERFEQGEAPDSVLHALPPPISGNPWLESRRSKLLFVLAQQMERLAELERALDVYGNCAYPGARVRRLRVLERLERTDAAYALACDAAQAPENESERQQLTRILPRLRRRLGLPKQSVPAAETTERIDLVLPQPTDGSSVEHIVAAHFSEDGVPTYYVENALITSLFGLLCWEAVFAPVPGAFFHPFHTGPADLYSPDFLHRRAPLFAACMAQLDSGAYAQTIHRTHTEKFGIQSPFVHWALLDTALKDMALACIPASDLKACFERILLDIRGHCAGLPDLIQFYPDAGAYRMIEVKGPGDRLQDNQMRWIAYFAEHKIPVAVCHVQWAAC